MFDERFEYCFNSYYETVGALHPRAKRGLLTRPRLDEVRAYRAFVDARAGAAVRRRPRSRGGRADRARHQSRAAAPGAAVPTSSTCSAPSRSARLPRGGAGSGWARPRRSMGRRRGIFESGTTVTASPSTTRAAARGAAPPVQARRPAGNEGRVARVHRGRRLQSQLWLRTAGPREGQDWQGPLYCEEGEGGYDPDDLMGFRALDPAAPVTHVAVTRPMRTPAGPAPGCRPSSSGAGRGERPVEGRSLGDGICVPMPAEPRHR